MRKGSRISHRGRDKLHKVGKEDWNSIHCKTHIISILGGIFVVVSLEICTAGQVIVVLKRNNRGIQFDTHLLSHSAFPFRVKCVVHNAVLLPRPIIADYPVLHCYLPISRARLEDAELQLERASNIDKGTNFDHLHFPRSVYAI